MDMDVLPGVRSSTPEAQMHFASKLPLPLGRPHIKEKLSPRLQLWQRF
jgi:hypothetical protein